MKVSKAMGEKLLKLAGGATPKRARRPRPPRKLAAGWSVTLALPCVVVSPNAQRREHWADRHERDGVQVTTLSAVLLEAGLAGWRPPLPVAVTLTRRGRPMDTDNLAASFKALRDGVARWLSVDDGSPEVTWEYDQRPGVPGVEVTIRPREG